MPRPAFAWMLAAALAGASQNGASVAEVVETVRQALAAHRGDGSLARALHKIKPAERIEDCVVEELESAGAGPKTVAELASLRDLSAALPAPNPPVVFPHPPPPSPDEQRGILARARNTAFNYTRSLPDFICTESVRRYENLLRGWEQKDTLEVRLTYFDQKESYKLVAVNGKPARVDYRSVGGAVTEGEFGSTQLSLFHPDSVTQFHWEHWTTLRGRPAYVFSFHIAVENSTYQLQFRRALNGPEYDATTGQHGLVYVDAETSRVVRIVTEADTIPLDFPVRASGTTLDYGFTVVGDQQFLLPLSAVLRMTADRLQIRNLVEFRNYRKFTGESTITFH